MTTRGHSNGPKNFGLALNGICHAASGVMLGSWVARIMSGGGELNAAVILKALIISVGIAAGLIALSSTALHTLPTIREDRQRMMGGILLAAYLTFAIPSGIASSAIIGESTGEAAAWQHGLKSMKDDIDRVKDLSARVYAIVPTLSNCVATSEQMGRREVVGGDVSGMGGLIGPVATEIESIHTACLTARDTLVASRATTGDIFVEMDRTLEKARRIANNRDLDRRDAEVQLVKLSNDLAKQGKDINQAIPIAALDAAAKAVQKDRAAMGLPAASVAVLQANFKPVSVALGSDLDEIAEQLEAPFQTIDRHVNPMDYLVMFPLALLPALAVSLLLELIPVIVVICALMTLEEEEVWHRKPSARRT